MKTATSLILLLAIHLLSSGCRTWSNADQSAREVALVTGQRVLAIREELRAKIAAERKFYKAQFDTIEKSQVRSDENELRRVNASQVDELLRNKDNLSAETIAAQLLRGSTNLFNELRLAREKRREQRELSEKSIRELELLDSQYEALNKTLLQLTTPPATRDQMAQVAVFIKSVADNYKRLQEEAAAGSASK